METILKALPVFFSWLIDYTIDISLFICLIFVLKSIVAKRLPAWWHYGLWLVLIIRMIIPLKYENSSMLPEFISLKLPDVELLNSMIVGKDDMISGIIENTSSNISWHWLDLSFNEVMLYTWLIGALSIGLFVLIKNLRFWFTIKQKPMMVDKDILDLLEECKVTMKINTLIGLIITDEVKSPVLFGYLRPRLLLPEGVLEKLTRSELTYIFMHELGHLKRHDIGVSWIITMLQVLHWFNPLVWYAFYQMRIDQESACDASVLVRIRKNQAKDYAGTIIGFLEKFCQNRQLPAMAGIIENKSQIKRRIAMIVSYKENTKRIKALAIVMLLVTGFIFYTITGFAQEATTDTNTTTSKETYINPAGEPVYRLDEIDTPPQVIEAVAPEYPIEAKEKNIEGKVLLKFIIGKDGSVLEPQVVSTELPGPFDKAALEAVAKYRFKPATKNGEEVNCFVRLPITFLSNPNDKTFINPEGEPVYRLDEIDTPPQVIETFPPQYPIEAKEKKLEPKLFLSIIVGKDGIAHIPQVDSAKPIDVFFQAALDAVAKYKFKPAIKDGKDVSCITNIPIEFKLDEKPVE
jgi:bla regulator protein blaR1